MHRIVLSPLHVVMYVSLLTRRGAGGAGNAAQDVQTLANNTSVEFDKSSKSLPSHTFGSYTLQLYGYHAAVTVGQNLGPQRTGAEVQVVMCAASARIAQPMDASCGVVVP